MSGQSAASSDLESRLAALESALALPHEGKSGGVEAAALSERVSVLEEALRKSNYRIVHLVRAYEAKCAEVESLQRKE